MLLVDIIFIAYIYITKLFKIQASKTYMNGLLRFAETQGVLHRQQT